MADNGSVDGAPEAAEREFDGARLLRTGGNIGYGGAINMAIAQADPEAEFVLVANPDVEWTPGSIDELLAAAARWPRAGALGPMVTELVGTLHPPARAVPGLAHGAGRALPGKVWPRDPRTLRSR